MMRLEHRQFSPIEETIRKAARLVDEETGIIRLLHEAPIPPDAPKIFGCGSLCSDFGAVGYPADNPISGSTSLMRDQAIVGAIGEAVERYSAAFVPYDQVTVCPYSSVASDAIAPWALTLYDHEQYHNPHFGYSRVHADDPIGWVIGRSLTRDVDVLTPAFAVYQPYASHANEPPMMQQITTGLACGNSVEEAALAAMCEVVERDAAMLMWLQRRRPPQVIPELEADSPASEAFRRFGALHKYVKLLDITTDLSIPAYVAVWDGRINGESGAIFASCAKHTRTKAAVGALAELAQCLLWAGSLIDNQKRLPDPSIEELSRIEEHVLWPLRPSTRAIFEFALSSPKSVRFEEEPESYATDVLDAIERCVRFIAGQGLEVIVVDVTSPDVLDSGLHVVRAIIPGSQPLFFGSGMHRISDRARQNEYPDRADMGINLYPHPFP
jgi:ribosomal protein S12 methylthiotransferase accessory factor